MTHYVISFLKFFHSLEKSQSPDSASFNVQLENFLVPIILQIKSSSLN